MSEITKNNNNENKDLSIYQINENKSTINKIKTFKRNIPLADIKKSKLKYKAIKLLKDIDKKKENNSIFLTEERNSERGLKTVKIRKKRKSLIKSYNDKSIQPFEDFNVFGNEDKFVKDLMEKFNNKSQPKMPKKDKRKEILNKLYGIDPQFSERMNRAKRNKKVSLEEYQANTFRVLTTNNIGKSELFDLAYNLKNLRLQSDSVSPLPRINIKNIYDHVYRNNNNNIHKINKMTIKQLINETHEPKDEFEKEEKLIKQLMSYKIIQRGKRNKAFDILPDYLKTALSKRFKNNI